MELCNIRDCTYPEECTILTDGKWGGRQIYILPQWKERGLQGGLFFAVKLWNPDQPDGIEFEIYPFTRKPPTVRLQIGAKRNEKIVLYYNNKLVKEKTSVHILPSGRWVEFWLQIRKGEIMLGYEGIPSSLFEWKHEDFNFEPFFLSYKSIDGSPVGVYFKCDECHTENVTTEIYTHVYPIGLWQPTEGIVRNNFTLKMRGAGDVIITLMNMPREKDFFMLDIHKREVKFVKVYFKDVKVLHKLRLDFDPFYPDKWTIFFLEFNETYVKLSSNSTLILEYNSNYPLMFYWFSLTTKTWVTWTANCDPLDIDGDPLDGGWGEWSKWECSVTCGGGEGTRSRSCSNPRPNIFGKLCQGSYQSTGKCNEFPCGDISPNTMDKIRMRLRTFHFSLVVEEGDPVVIPNDMDMLVTVKEESSEAYYEWSHNGLFINEDEERVKIRDNAITIKNVRLSDVGIYVCMIYRTSGQRLIVRVVTLAVTTQRCTISTRATLSMTLKSNAVILGYIYSELSQVWLIDDVIYKDYGITTLAAVSSEVIPSLNKSHAGVWKCVVTQKDLKLSWITNWIRVEIKRTPTMYTHLMEDSLTAPFFSWMKYDEVVFGSLVFVVVLVFGGVAFGVYAYLKWGVLPIRYKKLRN